LGCIAPCSLIHVNMLCEIIPVLTSLSLLAACFPTFGLYVLDTRATLPTIPASLAASPPPPLALSPGIASTQSTSSVPFTAPASPQCDKGMFWDSKDRICAKEGIVNHVSRIPQCPAGEELDPSMNKCIRSTPRQKVVPVSCKFGMHYDHVAKKCVSFNRMVTTSQVCRVGTRWDANVKACVRYKTKATTCGSEMYYDHASKQCVKFNKQKQGDVACGNGWHFDKPTQRCVFEAGKPMTNSQQDVSYNCAVSMRWDYMSKKCVQETRLVRNLVSCEATEHWDAMYHACLPGLGKFGSG
jgi:hypothetical protein